MYVRIQQNVLAFVSSIKSFHCLSLLAICVYLRLLKQTLMARMFIFGVVKIWRLFADEQPSSSPGAMNQTLETGEKDR